MPLMGVIGDTDVLYEKLQVRWKISKFFSLPVDATNFYDSPNFRFMNASWNLRIYPGGDEKHEGDIYISVYVIINSGPAPLETLTYKLGIEKGYFLVKEVCNSCCSFGVNEGRGLSKFFLRSELSKFARSDILYIICALTSHRGPYTFEKDEPMKLIELGTLSRNLEELLANNCSCDFTLKVKDKEFPVHKSILAARSSVLAAMLRTDMSEKETGVVFIEDCDPDSFGDFLRYLYTGKVENLSSSSAVHLYSTADKYNVQALKGFCLRYLMKNLTVENVCDVITMAELHDEAELVAAATEFFNKNVREVVLTDQWETLMKKDYRLANKLIIELTSKIKIES